MLKSLFQELIVRIERQRHELNGYSIYPEFMPFKNQTEEKLLQLKMQILEILKSDDWVYPNIELDFSKDYQRKNEAVLILEYYRTQVLFRSGKTVLFFFLLTKLILKQFKVQASTPMFLVSAKDTDYFWAEPVNYIISVPPNEDFHLLNLPDLIHELAHLIIDYIKTESNLFGEIKKQIKMYYEQCLWDAEESGTYTDLQKKIKTWQKFWESDWLIEFSCDMFATYFVGEAYAWTNIKISLAEDTEKIYDYDSEKHPPHESRKRAINAMLRCIGESDKIEKIDIEWKKLFKDNPPAYYYDIALPDLIIKHLAAIIHQKCKERGYLSYIEQLKKYPNSIAVIMNQAWGKLRLESEIYEEWEQEKIKEIKKMIDFDAEFCRKI